MSTMLEVPVGRLNRDADTRCYVELELVPGY